MPRDYSLTVYQHVDEYSPGAIVEKRCNHFTGSISEINGLGRLYQNRLVGKLFDLLESDKGDVRIAWPRLRVVCGSREANDE